MSYDLFFLPETEKFSMQNFTEYFSGRENYTVNGTKAGYNNKDTGVYFRSSYYKEEDTEEDETYYPLTFNLNYFRPCYFAMEAEIEITNAIKELKLSVNDPQIGGMGEGQFEPPKFYSGWKNGNNAAYESFLQRMKIENFSTFPERVLINAWEWNIRCKTLQDSVGESVFVPKIMFFKYNDRPVTAAVWPDAIPSILPPVDVLIINRDNLAPTKLFKKTSDMVIAPWAKFLPSLEKYSKKENDKAYHLSYQTVPKDLQKLIKSMPSSRRDDLEGLEYLLEKELVEKYSQKAS